MYFAQRNLQNEWSTNILAQKKVDFRNFCSNETLKIMKYRTPISMFNVFKTSNRKTTQMVTPTPDIQYAYNASITWNWARQVIKSNTDISDFSFSSADAKAILKNHILMSQKMGNPCEWNKYRDKLVLF